jgi:hypothetical protein
MYEHLSIPKLKKLGHQLLDEYIALDQKRSPHMARKHAYEKLAARSSDILNYGKVHFGNMDYEYEIIHAISTLKDMIKRRKRKNEWKGKPEYADPAVVKKALEELKNKNK